MKYKVGDKFILEIQDFDDEEYCEYPYVTEVDYFCENELDKLPQLVKGVDTYSYSKGAEDAWELMKRINEPRTMPENLEMFRALGVSEFCQVFELLTPQEAKVKFDAWKKANKEIKVGDVVNVANPKGGNGIVSRTGEGWCTVIWDDGSCGEWEKSSLTKTGENYADKVSDIISCISK